VGQVVSRDTKVYTLKDVNRGTVWDGPLLVLVNGSSASASEMVAGTLQDYHRALIVGSATYGKATAQVVLPLDTALDLERFDPRKEASSYLKVTISKLYRVSGGTAQMTGVRPDVELPDPPESRTPREADEVFALNPSPIAANKYYIPLAALPVDAERALAQKAMSGNAFFANASGVRDAANAGQGAGAGDGAGAGAGAGANAGAGSGSGAGAGAGAGSGAGPGKSGKKPLRDWSLNLDDQIAEKRALGAAGKKGTTAGEEKNELFTVGTPAYEAAASEERKKDVLADPYLQVAYQLVVGMMK
jgi:hypothetical protein